MKMIIDAAFFNTRIFANFIFDIPGNLIARFMLRHSFANLKRDMSLHAFTHHIKHTTRVPLRFTETILLQTSSSLSSSTLNIFTANRELYASDQLISSLFSCRDQKKSAAHSETYKQKISRRL